MDLTTGHVRLAGWPGAPLPLPLGPNGHEYAITEAGAIVAVTRREHWGDAPSPRPRPYHEAYLHLFALDLSSDEAISEFLNRFGPLSVDGGERPLGFDWHAGFRAHVRDWLKEAGAPIVAELPYWDDLAGEDAHYLLVQSLEEFRWQAWCLRDLVRAWRWYHDGVAVGICEWESPVWIESDDLIHIPEDREGAAELLRHGIRSGLTPFHPELRIATSDDDPRWETTYGGGLGYYCICCLELYNHIVAEAALIACSNERCARLFVHQEGRAKHGQHRSIGVKYCSPECARAQAQRVYRRRKATA